MIKLGILDFDSSHCVEFTRRLNHFGDEPEQWIEGAKVVVGCPGESKLSPERIPGFTDEMSKMGVALVDDPAEMIGKVDGMLIESVDGSVHFERAKPFLEAGIPCFIDKPFTCCVADAHRIIELAESKRVPIFSSWSLRYSPELVEFSTQLRNGTIIGAATYGPAHLQPRNPGLFHYGIHSVELLYTLMGPGCQRVACMSDKDVDQATGHWKDGRIGTIRGIRNGDSGYGALIFGETNTELLAIATKFVYRELLRQIVDFSETGRSPLEIAETLEIVGFIEAALKSALNKGSS